MCRVYNPLHSIYLKWCFTSTLPKFHFNSMFVTELSIFLLLIFNTIYFDDTLFPPIVPPRSLPTPYLPNLISCPFSLSSQKLKQKHENQSKLAKQNPNPSPKQIQKRCRVCSVLANNFWPWGLLCYAVFTPSNTVEETDFLFPLRLSIANSFLVRVGSLCPLSLLSAFSVWFKPLQILCMFHRL